MLIPKTSTGHITEYSISVYQPGLACEEGVIAECPESQNRRVHL
jgi:hypothetical protein